MKFKKVAVGGTFDYLHDGHQAILSKAFEIGERVVIGICSDEMGALLMKDSAGVSPLESRKQALEKFLHSRGWFDRAEIVVINDVTGPATSDAELEAIVVSPETKVRAEYINKIRAFKGLMPLEIVEIPFVLAEDGNLISSIRVRYDEIDVHGKLKKRNVL